MTNYFCWLLIHSCLKKEQSFKLQWSLRNGFFKSSRFYQTRSRQLGCYWCFSKQEMTLQLSHGFETWQPIHKLWQKVQQSKWGAHWVGDISNCKVCDQIDEHHNHVAYIKQHFLLRKKEVTHHAWIDGTLDSCNFQKQSNWAQKKNIETLVPLRRLEIVLQ
jgi:hypothetical protein